MPEISTSNNTKQRDALVLRLIEREADVFGRLICFKLGNNFIRYLLDFMFQAVTMAANLMFILLYTIKFYFQLKKLHFDFHKN